jgi:hypothetical protein
LTSLICKREKTEEIWLEDGLSMGNNMKNILLALMLIGCLCSIAESQSIECIGSLLSQDNFLTGVCAKGNLVYITGWDPALIVVNISNPYQPIQIGQLYNGSAEDIQVEAPFAYLTNYYGGIGVINISNPTNPQFVGGYNSGRLAMGIFIIGNLCYLANTTGGLKIFNISSPPDPNLIGAYYPPDGYDSYAISIVGSYAYLVEDFGGLYILDITDPYNPTLTGHCLGGDRSWAARQVAVAGDYAYISKLNGYSSGFFIVNISDPFNPYPAGGCDGLHNCQSIYVRGNYLYAGSDDLRIYDISNPINPELLATYDAEIRITDILPYGEFILIVGIDRFIILRFNPTGIDDDNLIPNTFSISQNYPNPFNAQTTIQYSLPRQSTVLIDIFDILGRKIETLAEGIKPVGIYQAIWDASKQSSGIYFYRIKADDKIETRKMVLLK